ncbi:MAG TPA: hypothetical protein VGC58_00095 [Candidatus Paceibacterota bacterium]
MKYIIFISSAIVVLLLGVYYFGWEGNKSIIDLKTYWINYGFSITKPESNIEEEKRAFEEKVFLKTEDKTHPVRESEDIYVDDIYLNVTSYKDKAVALDYYDQLTTAEKNKKESSLQQGTKYYRSDYYINGTLIMKVDYYRLTLKDSEPEILNIDKEKLNKIVVSFKKFE